MYLNSYNILCITHLSVEPQLLVRLEGDLDKAKTAASRGPVTIGMWEPSGPLIHIG